MSFFAFWYAVVEEAVMRYDEKPIKPISHEFAFFFLHSTAPSMSNLQISIEMLSTHLRVSITIWGGFSAGVIFFGSESAFFDDEHAIVGNTNLTTPALVGTTPAVGTAHLT